MIMIMCILLPIYMTNHYQVQVLYHFTITCLFHAIRFFKKVVFVLFCFLMYVQAERVAYII